MHILITGGAGFIGSAVIREIINKTQDRAINFDKLTYAGNLESLKSISSNPRYSFVHGDINDKCLLTETLNHYKPDIIMHLAAESHVDRSIDGPSDFMHANILGTYTLLEAAREYWQALPESQQKAFRFHHISTDEVYGDLKGMTDLFTETTPYAPSSPYSASKAASDHLVRAWLRTYNLPCVITNCSNNYGPYQFPEKLIPLIITNALKGEALPIYGNGMQIRDWLHVEDHARALYLVATTGSIGETYNIGGHNEKNNLEVVESICDALEELIPHSAHARSKDNPAGFKGLIQFVKDRPGHDVRYAIDAAKIQRELNWVPEETFDTGLRKTISWYLANNDWCQHVLDGSYRKNNHSTSGGKLL